MSFSCIGTCSNCGARRLWLSDTMSLQLDDGRLKCLPHPAEGGVCEEEGLTLAQARERGRLYCETFYVCRNCGRDGETIEKQVVEDSVTFPGSRSNEMGLGNGGDRRAPSRMDAMVARRCGDRHHDAGFTWYLLVGKQKDRKSAGCPRSSARRCAGLSQIAEPTAGCCSDTVIGQPLKAGECRATGPCCDRPDWIEAHRLKDEDRVPCPTCRQGVMVVSEFGIS